MTLASGALSGLTLNGEPISVTGSASSIAGGRLGALFEVRDETTIEAQSRLDGLARDLIERFEDPAVDPSLTPGDPGLFTDGGAALDPLDTLGLSARLSVNSAVDPAQGGALWRLRDGVGAVAPGPVGESALLQRFSDILATTRPASDPVLGGVSRTFAGFASDSVARISQSAENAEKTMVFSQSRRDTLKDAELAQGVDTDQEMQQLLLIEQAYAANARVIQTVDEMIRALLEL